MDFQKLKDININKILAGVGILIIIVSIISFQEQIPKTMDPRSYAYDKSLIPTIKDLVNMVPSDSVVVVSGYAALVNYFTDHKTLTPYSASTKDELVNFMLRKDYDYLLVFEGKSSKDDFRSLFSSEGLKSLDDEFELMTSSSSDFSNIYLYKLEDHFRIDSTRYQGDNVWQVYTINESRTSDFGSPDMSAINAIRIRIADDGASPVSVWLGALSLVDEDGKESMITDFQSQHGFRKVQGPGTQSDDTVDFVFGAQSLKLETDGDGLEVITRKAGILPSIDFTGQQLKLWIKISDISEVAEIRVLVSNDGFKDFRNYWIQKPSGG